MQENFDIWNNKKKEINTFELRNFNVNTREIWWCSLGMNIGSEQNGIGDYFERPVVVLRRLSTTTFIVLPLSTKKKLKDFQYEVAINNTVSYILLDQIRVIDIRRFMRMMGYLDKKDFQNVLQRFIGLLYKSKDSSFEESISGAEAAVM